MTASANKAVVPSALEKVPPFGGERGNPQPGLPAHCGCRTYTFPGARHMIAAVKTLRRESSRNPICGPGLGDPACKSVRPGACIALRAWALLMAVSTAAAAQGPSPAPSAPKQTEADEYTRYELLEPGTGRFRIRYEVTATAAGGTRFFNPIRKRSWANDEAVSAPLPRHPPRFGGAVRGPRAPARAPPR